MKVHESPKEFQNTTCQPLFSAVLDPAFERMFCGDEFRAEMGLLKMFGKQGIEKRPTIFQI